MRPVPTLHWKSSAVAEIMIGRGAAHRRIRAGGKIDVGPMRRQRCRRPLKPRFFLVSAPEAFATPSCSGSWLSRERLVTAGLR